MRHTNCTHESTAAARAKCRKAQTAIVATSKKINANVAAKKNSQVKLPFADAVAAVRSRIATEGYGSAIVELDGKFAEDFEDSLPKSMKIFTIADDGFVDAKVYSGCETSFYLRDCVDFRTM